MKSIMKKLIVIMFFLFLSILDSCTIITYKYETQEDIIKDRNNKIKLVKLENLKYFQDFFNKFKNELKDYNGSGDIINKYIYYSSIKNNSDAYSLILSYTNFVSFVSKEYNEIYNLSLEEEDKNQKSRKNKWYISSNPDNNTYLLYRTFENEDEYIGCVFSEISFQWKIIKFIKH